MLKTPLSSIMTRNLDSFSRRWQTVLANTEFESLLNEMKKLRRHITNGCLSGIEPGAGTAGNERIHRTLNTSLLCGTSIVRPELAIAILTVLFYSLNSKRKREKHFKNYRVVPHVPLDMHKSENQETVTTESDSAFNNSMNNDAVEDANEISAPVSLDNENDNRAVYTRENKPWLTLAAAYVGRGHPV